MDLEKFYFTYGSDDVQPYCGGWTEVWAPNYQMACQAFRAVHPDRIPNILNCSSVYSAREFEKTKMFSRAQLRPPLPGDHHSEHRCQQGRGGGDFLKVRGKKLTRKQKEALSAQGWDFRLYLCVRDGPDFMELVNRTTGKYVMFRK